MNSHKNALFSAFYKSSGLLFECILCITHVLRNLFILRTKYVAGMKSASVFLLYKYCFIDNWIEIVLSVSHSNESWHNSFLTILFFMDGNWKTLRNLCTLHIKKICFSLTRYYFILPWNDGCIYIYMCYPFPPFFIIQFPLIISIWMHIHLYIDTSWEFLFGFH